MHTLLRFKLFFALSLAAVLVCPQFGVALAPPSRFADDGRKKSLAETLQCALDDIFLFPDARLQRAKKIYGTNPERVDDLVLCLRSAGAQKLGLAQDALGRVTALVESLRDSKIVSRKALEQAAGISDRELFLFALDHALNPDPYHPVRSRAYYREREDRWIFAPWLHAVGMRAEDNPAAVLQAQISKREGLPGTKGIWVHLEYPGDIYQLLVVAAPNPLWVDLVNLLLNDDKQQHKYFTKKFFQRHRGHSAVRGVLEIIDKYAYSHIPYTLTRRDMEEIRSNGSLAGVRASPYLAGLVQNFLELPQLEGLVLEPAGYDLYSELNLALATYLDEPRFARLHLSRRTDELVLSRYRGELFYSSIIVDRDDRTLDTIAEIADAHPDSCVAVIRGEGHWPLGYWLRSDYDPADIFEKEPSYEELSAPLFLGRNAYREYRDRDIPLADILSEIDISFSWHAVHGTQDAMEHLKKSLPRLDTGTLQDLQKIRWRYPYDSGVRLMQALYEKGIFLDEDQHPCWRTLSEFRYKQFVEVMERLRRYSHLRVVLQDRLGFSLVFRSVINSLGQGLSGDEKTQLARKIYDRVQQNVLPDLEAEPQRVWKEMRCAIQMYFPPGHSLEEWMRRFFNDVHENLLHPRAVDFSRPVRPVDTRTMPVETAV